MNENTGVIAEAPTVDWDALDAASKLEILAGLRDQRTVLALPFQAQIGALEQERDRATAQVDEDIAACEASIRAEILAGGQSVSGSRFMALYYQGRTTWDGKALAAYAKINKAILAYRHIGEPSVVIRAK